MQITTIGLDLAKNVFQVHAINSASEVVVKKAPRRVQMRRFGTQFHQILAQMLPSTRHLRVSGYRETAVPIMAPLPNSSHRCPGVKRAASGSASADGEAVTAAVSWIHYGCVWQRKSFSTRDRERNHDPVTDLEIGDGAAGLDHHAHGLMAHHIARFHLGHEAPIRCRSEPQMAQAVTLMTTSRGSWIVGSGTVSHLMSSLPCQHSARIAILH
jgi:hypothetical protein